MSKAWACIIGTGLGIPTIMMCVLTTENFYVSIAGLGLEYLVAECWIGPAITMVINTISPQNKGFAVGAFLFWASISGMCSTLILGALDTHHNYKEDPKQYGKVLCMFVAIPYALSIPFFYLAGRGYADIKK